MSDSSSIEYDDDFHSEGEEGENQPNSPTHYGPFAPRIAVSVNKSSPQNKRGKARAFKSSFVVKHVFEQLVQTIILKVRRRERGNLYENIGEIFYNLDPAMTEVSPSSLIAFLGSLNIPVHDGDVKVFFEVVSRSGRVSATVSEIARVICKFEASPTSLRPNYFLRSPVTNLRLPDGVLVPNYGLRSMIESWKEETLKVQEKPNGEQQSRAGGDDFKEKKGGDVQTKCKRKEVFESESSKKGKSKYVVRDEENERVQ